MGSWTKVREHIWTDEHGAPILRHTKYLLPNGDVVFPWETRVVFGETGIARWFKGIDPSTTPPLLNGLPAFVAASRDEHIFVGEGEADQGAATAHGLLAVTAGAAGAFGSEHARLFRGWRGLVTIVRDRDLPGAYGAAKAYDALRSVGLPASRLRVARGRCKCEGADLKDHLDAGYTVDQLVSEPIAKVRKLAAKATPETFARAGYSGGINPETGFVWVGVDELEQLKDWKPVVT